MHLIGKALWGHIWKHTVEKSLTNATNVTMHPPRQVIWGHIWKHTGERSNKCNQCDFTSSQAGNMCRHLKTHRGEQSNKCNQCNYAASRASHMRVHLKPHNGENTIKWKHDLLKKKLEKGISFWDFDRFLIGTYCLPDFSGPQSHTASYGHMYGGN